MQFTLITCRFRMKIFTPLLADTKALIGRIKAAHMQSSAIQWMYLREIESGDKRANFGLLLHGIETKAIL